MRRRLGQISRNGEREKKGRERGKGRWGERRRERIGHRRE
jgi:hypothetical protein